MPCAVTVLACLRDLCARIRRYRFATTTESDLHEAIAMVFTREQIRAEREWSLSEHDRPDFWLPAEGLVVECKVDGSMLALARQVLRYCEHDEVRGVIVVTTRAKHLALPSYLGGKPVAILFTGRSAL